MKFRTALNVPSAALTVGLAFPNRASTPAGFVSCVSMNIIVGCVLHRHTRLASCSIGRFLRLCSRRSTTRTLASAVAHRLGRHVKYKNLCHSSATPHSSTHLPSFEAQFKPTLKQPWCSFRPSGPFRASPSKLPCISPCDVEQSLCVIPFPSHIYRRQPTLTHDL